jgi:radical S-adenosyl methionine domain-containing protein 2
MDARVPVETVNFHVWQPCNMRCDFCFATFRDMRRTVLPEGHLPQCDAEHVVTMLADAGFTKITFAGGEPLLCPWIIDLIALASESGLRTSLVTNGSLLDAETIRGLRGILDWVTISIDSVRPSTLNAIGRVTAARPASERYYLDLCRKLKRAGLHLKINTVVTAANYREDLTGLIVAARPERWKLFQVLPVWGQNSGKVEPLLITAEQFACFIELNEPVWKQGVYVVAEDNESMTGSYAMVDPAGRFFDAVGHGYTYSDPILDVGVARALSQVVINREKFLDRGGLY